jgi:hypothetical protein
LIVSTFSIALPLVVSVVDNDRRLARCASVGLRPQSSVLAL